MNQPINIEDYLEPTDPPLPLPAIETFKGTNTLDSTIEVGKTMITQGYRIPLITMDAKTAEYVYKTDVFIGDSPLTEGESVSKSSTGLDIKTITIGADDYPNRLITSLSNKPEMTIKYKTKGGN